jgi:hypothetical protein
MARNNALNFGGKHFEARGVDHVLLAIDNEDGTILIHAREITGVQPPIRLDYLFRCCFISKVALHFRYAEVRTITAAIVAALLVGGVIQTSIVRSPILTETLTIGLRLTVVTSKLYVKCVCFLSVNLRRWFQRRFLRTLELQ